MALSFFHGRRQREPAQLGDPGHQAGEVLAAGPGPRGQRPVGERERGVGHDQLGVDLEPRAQPGAGRAGAVGGVEREVARGRLLEAQPAVGAGQVLAEGDGLVLLGPLGRRHRHLGRATGEAERRLDRLGQPLADAVAADQAVDHHLDGVLLVAGQVHVLAVGQLDHLAVDPDPGEPLLGHVVEEAAVLALATPDHRGEHLEPGAVGQLHHPVDDLLGGLAGHRAAAGRAVGLADAGVEEAEVVVDLGDGAHRRARVARGRLLVDGDGRGQPLDEVDVGLVHLPQELAGVGRERLDVAALALGVDGVEGQGGLARPRQPGEDHQLVAGQVEGDVLEVVLPGPPDD